MKKLLLATAVATLCVSTAQAAPTLYGKLNVTLDQVSKVDYTDNNQTEVNSNASRIGVKGEEKLTDNLSAVYLAEWEIATDSGDSDLKARNRFLGLKFANIGTLKAGFFDTYFKNAAGGNQDIFNDHNRLDITKNIYGEDRAKNALGFETDKKLLGGLQFNIQLAQGESATADEAGTTGDNSKRNGFGDSISTSLIYDNKDLGLALGLAGNFNVPGKYNAHSLSGIYSDAYRITGSYDFANLGAKGLVLGALWQQAEPKDDLAANPDLEEQAFTVTAAYAVPSTPWKVKAEYVSAETTVQNKADRNFDQYGVGVDYNLNKQTRFYGVLAQQKRDWKTEDKQTTFGLGLEYNF